MFMRGDRLIVMEIVVQPIGLTLTSAPGMNLLDVLREHQVPISYSCTAGRCGTCRCRILKGNVLEAGPQAKLTSPHDGRFVLACMSSITESCEIEVPEPDEVIIHPAKVLKGTVLAIEDMTHDIKRLRLRTNKPLAFSPGQYATLQFSTEHVRPYSMAGIDTDDELEFHIRLVPQGRVTGYISQQLRVGDTVRVSGPLGSSYLRRKFQGPMLCVAGGTGLAPVLSIVRGALHAGMTNPIHLYFGVRSPVDVYGMQWLEELAKHHANLSIHLIVGSGKPDHRWRVGLVTDAIAEDWSTLSGWRAYLCGAPPMVDAARLLVGQRGIEIDHIYADAFYAAAD